MIARRVSSEHERQADESADGLNFHRSCDEAIPCLLTLERARLARFAVISEPACGDGALVEPLRQAGFHVVASDIADRGCSGANVCDFLDGSLPLIAARARLAIITNPPFNRAEEFVLRACELADYVAMILRLRWLGPQHYVDADGKRCITGEPVWRRTRIPFAGVIIPASRWPMMHRDDYEGPKLKGGMTDLAWFIWRADYRGSPEILREPLKGDNA